MAPTHPQAVAIQGRPRRSAPILNWEYPRRPSAGGLYGYLGNRHQSIFQIGLALPVLFPCAMDESYCRIRIFRGHADGRIKHRTVRFDQKRGNAMIRLPECCSAAFLVMMLAPVFAIAFAGGPRQEKAVSPAAPAQSYVVASGESITQIAKTLHAANKLQDLINAPNVGCRVYIQHESDVATNQAEVHDAADDIFQILEGTAIFVLGGQLDAAKETQPGEWRAPGITGGKEYKVGKGDMLIVPRGTPHRRITSGLDVTFMLIKSFAPVKK